MASNEENYIKLNCFIIPAANQTLQDLFLKQWRNSTNEEWKNTPDEGKAFTTGVGRRAWITSSRRQKKLLECGNIFLWDLGLCNQVLQKTDFGAGNGLTEQEKPLFNDLSMLQNEIHRNYKILMSNDDYESKIEKIEVILKQYEPSLEDRLTRLKLTGAANDLTAYALKELANSSFEEKKYEDAIRSYSQAIELTKVSNQLLGELYSNRSAVYLMIHDDGIGASLEDAKRAVQLLPAWFRGYYRLGCVYRLRKKYEKAAKYFSVALALEPNKSEIIPLRDECERRIPKPKSPIEILLKNETVSLQDTTDMLNKRFQTNMTPDGLKTLFKSKGSNLDFCLMKAMYLMRFEESPKKYEEILELLWKAANQNSTLALYHIANMYKLGVGVEIDMEKSIELLKQVASSPKSSDISGNIGIAFAENDLGVMYQQGTGLPIDLEESVKFYGRAAGNGNSFGAINLGLCYLKGTGVERNRVKAVQYLKRAAKLFDANAMLILARYYLLDAQDGDQALDWHQRAVSHGNLEAISKSGEFKTEVGKLKRQFGKIDKEMKSWEKSSGLAAADLSLKERRERFMEKSCPEVSKFFKSCSEVLDKFDKQQLPFSTTDKGYNFDVKVLEEFSKKGSVTAGELKKAIVHYNLAIEFFKCGRSVDCIHHLAESICISELVVDFNFCRKAVALITAEMDVYLTVLPPTFHRDLRVCVTMNCMMRLEKAVDFLTESVRMFPDFVWFRQLLASAYGFLRDTAKGLVVVNSALEKFPDNFHLWYAKAIFLYQSEGGNKKVLKRACEKYLSLAPPDERKVPQIYYTMAIGSGGRNEIEKYYRMGLEAEKLQLPYFLPVDCAKKSLLESMMGLFVPTESVDVAPVVVDEMSETKLTDPGRIAMITDHRTKIEKMFIHLRTAKLRGDYTLNTTWCHGLEQTGPLSLADIRPIMLNEMDPVANQIYKQRALSCQVIDEPSLGFNGVHVIVQDGNGDVERVTVYNIDQDVGIHDKLGYGCKIIIRNPYFKIAMDGKQLIRVDDVDSLVFDAGPDMSRCRYCGKTGSVLKCGRCYRATYCCKQCQINDWKILKHKLICYSNLS